MHLRVVSLVGSLNIEYFLSILKASITSDLPFIHLVCVCVLAAAAAATSRYY